MEKSEQHIKDLIQIMGVEEAMIRLLPEIEDTANLMNPWVRQLPGIFRDLKLQPGQVVLDIPCGKGGASVALAKKYGVKVIGYDLMEGFVELANKLAQKQKVGKLCRFQVGDIRKVTRQKDICDLLLWIAPPHPWPDSKRIMKALRNCVKDQGRILVADAYLYRPIKSAAYPDFETLPEMTRGFSAWGDRIIRFIDYQGRLWREDFYRTRKRGQATLAKLKNPQDRKIFAHYLKSLDREEKQDTKYLGLGIWIVKVNK